MGRQKFSVNDQIMGRVAVALGIISSAKLRDLLSEVHMDMNGKTLAQFMLSENLLDQESLAKIVRIQRKKRCCFVKDNLKQEEDEYNLCQILLEKSLVDLNDLETVILEKQRLLRKHLNFHIGEILINSGLVDRVTLLQLLREKRGEILYCHRCDMNFYISCEIPEDRWICTRCGEKLEEVSFLHLIEADGKVL